MAELSLGIARARLGPSASLIDSANGLAACEENRLTRARQASTAGPPELAIQELLSYLTRDQRDVRRLAVVRDLDHPDWWHGEWWPEKSPRGAAHLPELVEIDHVRAHALYALAGSRFDDAVAVVCDVNAGDGYSAMRAGATELEPSVGHFPIISIYSALTEALGFQREREEHLVEAMARAGDASRSTVSEAISLSADGIVLREDFQQAIASACAITDADRARRDVAADVQQKLGHCLNELLARLARQSGARRVCLSGGLFFNTYFTTTAAASGAFADAYIPPHPGRVGASVGAAIFGSNTAPASVGSPYLGPGYSDPQVKEALENCKLSYDLQREEQVIDTVLRALSRGRLVGWFHGRLEWGPRALGHRTVLADPLSPHVLDNLNGYLKKRPAYRTYGVSVPLARLDEFFAAPEQESGIRDQVSGVRDQVSGTKDTKTGLPASPFMQYEYRPRDLERFRAILPEGVKTLRVHTVDASEPRYLRLLERWGEMSGTPVLVNTSFNGFHEPLVCSPRDAIRVFYGTGLDLLALEDFVLRK